MIKNLFFILTGFSILLLTACEEKMGIMEQPEVFSIQPISIPAKISVSRVKTYTIAFKVTHPEGVDAVESVSVTFFGSDQSTPLLSIGLHDDGGVNHPNDGDVISRDGIYTNTFQSDSTVFPLGPVFISATAFDKSQQQLQTEFIESVSLLNAPPVLVSAAVPDTLPSGSPTVLFAVRVQDSNDVDDLDEVILSLKQQNLTIFSIELDLVNSPSVDTAVYGAFFDSTFSAERIGNYELEFRAVDLSDDSSNVLSNSVYLQNSAPILSNVELPDTVQRPASGTDTIEVRIRAKDPQGLSDIDFVTFIVQREGGMPTTLEMFDDGDFLNHRDIVAGDRIYSRGVTIDNTSFPANYRFTFEAKDRVDNFSEVLIDSLVILP